MLGLIPAIGSFLGKAGILSGIGSVLGGVSGLVNKPKNPSVQDNILAQAEAARLAADKYGFNPLTVLQNGNPAGTGLSNGGAPPLASIELLTSGLKDIADVTSGDADRRRAIEQHNLDLAKIKLDQARSGVIIRPNNAVDRIGSSQSAFGRRAATVVQGDGPVRSYASQIADRVQNGSGTRRNTLAGAKSDYVVPNRNHPLAGSLGVIGEPDTTLDRGSGIFVGGRYLEAPPGWSPGSRIEEEFGDTELIQAPYALAYSYAKAKHNLRRYIVDKRVNAARSKGVRVEKVGGEYYAQQPDKPKRPAKLGRYGTYMTDKVRSGLPFEN